MSRERGLVRASDCGAVGEVGRQNACKPWSVWWRRALTVLNWHPLHIVKGSTMAKAWEAGAAERHRTDDYTLTAGEMIFVIMPPEVLISLNFSASARRPTPFCPAVVRESLDGDG